MVQLRQGEADDVACVVLGNERDVLVAEVVVELAELVLEVDRDARQGRQLARELCVELAQPLAVASVGLADSHAGGAVRWPVNR